MIAQANAEMDYKTGRLKGPQVQCRAREGEYVLVPPKEYLPRLAEIAKKRGVLLIAEGFEQKTDRHFAHYLYIARGSARETITHLRIAEGRRYTAGEETNALCARYDEIAKMLTGLIQHLESDNRSHRWKR